MAIRKPASGQTSTVTSITASIGGLNSVDAVTKMPASDAVILENFYPTISGIKVREGAAHYGGTVGTFYTIVKLITYTNPSGVEELFSVKDVSTDSSSTKAVINKESGTPTTMLYFPNIPLTPSTATITTVGGTFLVYVDGANRLARYNGTAWSQPDLGEDPPINYTGIDTRNLSGVFLYKRRLWFIEKNALNLWYLPVTSIQGALTKFELGQVFTKGGRIVTACNWTVDGGAGMDDYLAIISSEGQIAVYQGSDPSSASDFALKGVYNTGTILGANCVASVGGEVLLLTSTGLVSLAQLLSGDSKTLKVANKVAPYLQARAQESSSLAGWEMFYSADKALLLINIPSPDGKYIQLVLNTLAGAWAVFTGWEARCWGIADSKIYFAGKGLLAQAFVGETDFGNPITALAQQAFTNFGLAALKHFKLYRAVITSRGRYQIRLAINPDYADANWQNMLQFGSVNYAVWDSSTWDSEVWADSLTTKYFWTTVRNTPAFSHSLKMQVTLYSGEFSWTATEYVLQRGGVL